MNIKYPAAKNKIRQRTIDEHVYSCFLLHCHSPPGVFGPKFRSLQNAFLIFLATSAKISPVFFCQLRTCLDSAHHSSPCRGSAFSQRFRTSACCSWWMQISNVRDPGTQCTSYIIVIFLLEYSFKIIHQDHQIRIISKMMESIPA